MKRHEANYPYDTRIIDNVFDTTAASGIPGSLTCIIRGRAMNYHYEATASTNVVYQTQSAPTISLYVQLPQMRATAW